MVNFAYLDEIVDAVAGVLSVLGLAVHVRGHGGGRVQRFLPHLDAVERMEHGDAPGLGPAARLVHPEHVGRRQVLEDREVGERRGDKWLLIFLTTALLLLLHSRFSMERYDGRSGGRARACRPLEFLEGREHLLAEHGHAYDQRGHDDHDKAQEAVS